MLIKIYDGVTNPSAIDTSSIFRTGDMLFMEAPDLPSDEGYELAASLRIFINNFQHQLSTIKEIPLDITLFDTNTVVKIPNEYTNSRFDLQLCLATAYSIRLKVFVIATDCSLQTICDKVDFGNTLLTSLSIRQLIEDVSSLAQAISLIVSLAQGDLTALAGLIDLLLPGIPDQIIPGDEPILIPGVPSGLPQLPSIYDPTNIFN